MKQRRRIPAFSYIALFLLTFLLDRITKSLVLSYVHGRIPITSFLSFDLTFNRGISWGLFHSSDTLIFSVVSIVIALLTCAIGFYAFIRWMNHSRILGEVLVVAGAFSNLIDRIVYHGVIDFVVISWGTWSWPVFNVADACIVLGVGLMLFESYQEP
jgi:signal peptidase II